MHWLDYKSVISWMLISLFNYYYCYCSFSGTSIFLSIYFLYIHMFDQIYRLYNIFYMHWLDYRTAIFNAQLVFSITVTVIVLLLEQHWLQMQMHFDISGKLLVIFTCLSSIYHIMYEHILYALIRLNQLFFNAHISLFNYCYCSLEEQALNANANVFCLIFLTLDSLYIYSCISQLYFIYRHIQYVLIRLSVSDSWIQLLVFSITSLLWLYYLDLLYFSWYSNITSCTLSLSEVSLSVSLLTSCTFVPFGITFRGFQFFQHA